MRLVSVVVPDWLMATTSTSDMSSGSPVPAGPQPDTSDGRQRHDAHLRYSPGDGRRYGLAGHGSRALTDDDDAVDPAGREGLADRRGYDVVPQTH